MRGDRHFRMCPERAINWQRFLIENVKRYSRKQPAIQCCQNIRFVLQAATTCVDQHRRAQWAVAFQLRKHCHRQNAFGVRCQRQKTDENIGRFEKAYEAFLAVEALNALDFLGATAPAGDIEAERLELGCCIATENPQPHDTDSHFMGRWLARVFMPDPVLLLFAVICAKTMVIKHLPDHIFGHAHGEII